MHFMRTTIDINDALLDRLKEVAREQGRPVTKLVNEVLERGLSSPKRKPPKIRIQTYPVGIRPAYRGMSMNQMYDQLETEDYLKVAEK
jgi:hypothetical protein